MDFKSRAVRSLVELHDHELRAFLETWRRFVASDKPMPDAHGDKSYQHRDALIGHVLMAARGYLTWMGDMLARPVTDVDTTKDVHTVAQRFDDFAGDVLA